MFVSDGLHNTAPGIGGIVVPAGVTIQAFAVGSGSDCTSGSPNSLNDVAALGGPGSTCTQVTDVGALPAVVPGVIDSRLLTLSLSVDGGLPVDISGSATPALPQTGPASVTFGPLNVPLAPGVHSLCVTATGSDAGGPGFVTDCITVTMVTITLAPAAATNELGTPGQTHTVIATVSAGASGGVAAQTVQFDVISGPNAGASGSGVTNASGEASFTYPALQGLAGLGTDVIRATIGPDSQGDTASATATKLWQDTTAPAVACTPSVNPHGANVPRASRTNEDGFYAVTATDAVDPDPQVFVGTATSPLLFGPFSSNAVFKFTEAPGATPSAKPMGSANGQAGAVLLHVTLDADAVATAVDASGNTAPVTCLVPPPPK